MGNTLTRWAPPVLWLTAAGLHLHFLGFAELYRLGELGFGLWLVWIVANGTTHDG